MSKKKIEINSSAVIRQIYAKAHYTARVRGVEAETEAIVSDIAEEDNQDILWAMAETAMREVQNVVAIYTPVKIEGDSEMITVEIDAPGNYDDNALAEAGAAIGSYIESHVLREWFAITSEADAAKYAEQKVMAVSAIRKALTRRNRPQYENDRPEGDKITLRHEQAQD